MFFATVGAVPLLSLTAGGSHVFCDGSCFCVVVVVVVVVVEEEEEEVVEVVVVVVVQRN